MAKVIGGNVELMLCSNKHLWHVLSGLAFRMGNGRAGEGEQLSIIRILSPVIPVGTIGCSSPFQCHFLCLAGVLPAVAGGVP